MEDEAQSHLLNPICPNKITTLAGLIVTIRFIECITNEYLFYVWVRTSVINSMVILGNLTNVEDRVRKDGLNEQRIGSIIMQRGVYQHTYYLQAKLIDYLIN